MFTIVGSALRPLLAISLVSHALTKWTEIVQQRLNTGQVSSVYVELADQLVQCLKHVYNAASVLP